jgi:hypothetical protein
VTDGVMRGFIADEMRIDDACGIHIHKMPVLAVANQSIVQDGCCQVILHPDLSMQAGGW